MAHTLARPLQRTQPSRRNTLRRVLGPEWQLGWLLVAPVVIVVAGIILYPFVDAILLSFQERFIGKTGTWIGAANYTSLFSDPNTLWPRALVTTFVVTGGAIITKFVIGMAMACVLNQDLPARKFIVQNGVPAQTMTTISAGTASRASLKK